MGKLKCLVVADPAQNVVLEMTEETKRLADRRIGAATGSEVCNLVDTHRPELLVLSLELKHPEAADVVKRIRKSHPELFIVATFRELAVPMMDRLGKLGVEDFIPQPIDYTQLYRAASNRFDTPFRRHARYPIRLEIRRADGKILGHTRDISKGGLQMDATSPLLPDQSLLVDLALPQDKGAVRVRFDIIAVEGQAPSAVTARGEFQNLRGAELRRLSEFLAEMQQDYVD